VAGGFLVQFVPFYWLIKLLILIWLFHPMTNGASVIYDNVVHPLWNKHESKIDEVTRSPHRRADPREDISVIDSASVILSAGGGKIMSIKSSYLENLSVRTP
jgi:hypothetical protein